MDLDFNMKNLVLLGGRGGIKALKVIFLKSSFSWGILKEGEVFKTNRMCG